MSIHSGSCSNPLCPSLSTHFCGNSTQAKKIKCKYLYVWRSQKIYHIWLNQSKKIGDIWISNYPTKKRNRSIGLCFLIFVFHFWKVELQIWFKFSKLKSLGFNCSREFCKNFRIFRSYATMDVPSPQNLWLLCPTGHRLRLRDYSKQKELSRSSAMGFVCIFFIFIILIIDMDSCKCSEIELGSHKISHLSQQFCEMFSQ